LLEMGKIISGGGSGRRGGVDNVGKRRVKPESKKKRTKDAEEWIL